MQKPATCRFLFSKNDCFGSTYLVSNSVCQVDETAREGIIIGMEQDKKELPTMRLVTNKLPDGKFGARVEYAPTDSRSVDFTYEKLNETFSSRNEALSKAEEVALHIQKKYGTEFDIEILEE